jgi:hypothetical protein
VCAFLDFDVSPDCFNNVEIPFPTDLRLLQGATEVTLTPDGSTRSFAATR